LPQVSFVVVWLGNTLVDVEGSATALAFQPVLREEQIYWQTKLDFHQFKKKETPFQCLCKAECLENGG